MSEQLVPRDRNNSAAKEIRERLLHKEEVLTRIDKEVSLPRIIIKYQPSIFNIIFLSF